jgi:hypothetical protein
MFDIVLEAYDFAQSDSKLNLYLFTLNYKKEFENHQNRRKDIDYRLVFKKRESVGLGN